MSETPDLWSEIRRLGDLLEEMRHQNEELRRQLVAVAWMNEDIIRLRIKNEKLLSFLRRFMILIMECKRSVESAAIDNLIEEAADLLRRLDQPESPESSAPIQDRPSPEPDRR
jgi:hypothetical protein